MVPLGSLVSIPELSMIPSLVTLLELSREPKLFSNPCSIEIIPELVIMALALFVMMTFVGHPSPKQMNFRFVMVPELVMLPEFTKKNIFSIVPELIISPLLVTVSPIGTVTVIPEGIIMVLSKLFVTGGVAPPHVLGSVQSPD